MARILHSSAVHAEPVRAPASAPTPPPVQPLTPRQIRLLHGGRQVRRSSVTARQSLSLLSLNTLERQCSLVGGCARCTCHPDAFAARHTASADQGCVSLLPSHRMWCATPAGRPPCARRMLPTPSTQSSSAWSSGAGWSGEARWGQGAACSRGSGQHEGGPGPCLLPVWRHPGRQGCAQAWDGVPSLKCASGLRWLGMPSRLEPTPIHLKACGLPI